MEEDEFKDTEIGRIPKDWEIKKFKDCIKVISFKYSSLKSDYQNNISGKYPVIDQSSDYISGYSNEEGKLFNNPLPVIIFGDHTRIFKYINFPFIPAGGGIKILHSNCENLNLKFLYYQFSSFNIPSRGYNRHFIFLQKFLIKVPPLGEQKRITHILSKIENAIKIQDRIINSLQELKKSMMHKLFTEGIGHTEFKDTEIGRIPKEWEIKKISELFSIEHGISITPKRRKLRVNYPMLRTSNIGWGKISLEKIDYSWFSDDEIKNLNLQYGDLLVCEGGDIGRTAMWTGELEKVGYQNHLHRLRKKYDSVSPLFYMYWMQYAILYSHLYINEGNKTTIPNLSKSKIMNFNVVYTTYEEQKRIADILSAIDNKISIEEKRKDSFENLFKSMLNKLMTGQIRVKNLEMRE